MRRKSEREREKENKRGRERKRQRENGREKERQRNHATHVLQEHRLSRKYIRAILGRKN